MRVGNLIASVNISIVAAQANHRDCAVLSGQHNPGQTHLQREAFSPHNGIRHFASGWQLITSTVVLSMLVDQISNPKNGDPL